MTRHFLRDDDVTPVEQAEILELAARLKADRFAVRPLAGPQTVAVIFDKTSTRTRVSFATGIADLGGTPLIINPGESQLGGKESIADTARVMERMLAAIVWRTYAQSGLEEMAAGTAIPVVNALSDDFHPCQLLADLLTVQEHKGTLAGLKLVFVGDGANNMTHSYLLAGATAGMHVVIATPATNQPRADILADAARIAATTGGSVAVVTDPAEGVAGADVVATDTWISMGQEDEKAARVAAFAGYTVDAALMAQARQDAIFLHCLPAYRGYEVAAEVIDGPQSVIWDEAENRLHAQKALLAWLLEKAALDNGTGAVHG
ncbi:MAG TPA: ornithine carbamoyltransferase [Gryllotalpicola sp.]